MKKTLMAVLAATLVAAASAPAYAGKQKHYDKHSELRGYGNNSPKYSLKSNRSIERFWANQFTNTRG
jgi:hypothetical protein